MSFWISLNSPCCSNKKVTVLFSYWNIHCTMPYLLILCKFICRAVIAWLFFIVSSSWFFFTSSVNLKAYCRLQCIINKCKLCDIIYMVYIFIIFLNWFWNIFVIFRWCFMKGMSLLCQEWPDIMWKALYPLKKHW